MTDDDLQPRLAEHLRQRASRVSAPPDVADVHQRIEAQHRRRGRALGAALAVALVAGPVAGWAAAQAADPDRDTVTMAGGGGASDSGDDAVGGAGLTLEGVSPGHLDPQMELQSDRTTEAGIRLVVRTTLLDPQNPPCQIDGLVRVGIVDGQLIDVALVQTAPSHASFGIAGGADGRPMWVVVARATATVQATFPNGAADATEAVGGVAVLAAYADEGQEATELLDDVVDVTGLPGRSVEEGARQVTIADGSAGCPQVDPPISPPVDLTMPQAGEPPADEEAARAAITDTFTTLFDGSGEPHVELRERPEVWADANERFKQEHPDYAAMVSHVHGEVDEIVFTAPDQASVRFRLIADDPSIPAPGERIGVAVLIDGVWKLSIDTSCELIGLAGVECNHSVEE